MTSINTFQYFSLAETEIVRPVSEYEDDIFKEPEVHGVKWNKLNTYTSIIEPNKRPRSDFVWKVTYVCHRSEKYKSSAATNASVKARPGQKIGCPARLIVSCPRNDTENVILEYDKDHSHAVGTLEEMRFLSLSSKIKQLNKDARK
ncbi:hypothetical protein BDB01DRAFT_905209 [Pilobolus umbonatus]|nr:hypothetical protein BDB01DRAFT_905209 [Pilobolus umbonatus]